MKNYLSFFERNNQIFSNIYQEINYEEIPGTTTLELVDMGIHLFKIDPFLAPALRYLHINTRVYDIHKPKRRKKEKKRIGTFFRSEGIKEGIVVSEMYCPYSAFASSLRSLSES